MKKPAVTLSEQEIAQLIAEKTAEKAREILAAKYSTKYRALMAAAKKDGLRCHGRLFFEQDESVFW